MTGVLTTIVVAIVVAALGEVALSGAITLINTCLTAWLVHGQRRVRTGQRELRDAITAPRRMLYDVEGKPIGTVIDLNSDRHPSWAVHT